MTECPSNSTECLLRAILEANSNAKGVNWNALNAGLTAAVGFLALLVALTTVFQGVLGAGPGRLKASNRAIGPWSCRTTNWFSWSEFRVRSTAQVPFISSDSLSHVRKRAHGISLAQSSDYPATWVNLMAVLNLNYEKTSESNLSVQPCQTDYLPSDIQAAPAFATIEAIVNLACFAGCDTIEMVNSFPRCSGPSSQLEVRVHPQLGTIASYDQFPSITPVLHKLHQSLPSTGRTVRLEMLLDYSQGYFQFEGSFWLHSTVEKQMRASSPCAHDFCKESATFSWVGDSLSSIATYLLTADSPAYARAFPYASQHVFQSIIALMCCLNVDIATPSGFIDQLKPLVNDHGGKILLHYMEAFKYRDDYGYIINTEPYNQFLRQLIGMFPSPPAPDQVLDVDWSWLSEPQAGQSNRRCRPGWTHKESSNCGDLIISDDALDIVLGWLKAGQEKDEVWRLQKSKAAQAHMAFQLQEVDCFLLKNFRSQAICELRRFLINVEEYAPKNIPSTAAEWGFSKHPRTEIEKALATLLVFRAMLVAILLNMIPDNSMVYEKELGTRVIRCV